MLWDRYSYFLFTWEQTEDREGKQLNQGCAILNGMGGTEFPGIFVQCPFSQALLRIFAYSVIMMKLMLKFASTFKDLCAGHYSECFIVYFISFSSHSNPWGWHWMIPILGREKWNTKRLNNLPEVIQLLTWQKDTKVICLCVILFILSSVL